jgi:exodeoxyribonuclease-3
MGNQMKIVTWNVNGIRAALRKGLWDWVSAELPDVLCLQETRIHIELTREPQFQPQGYFALWSSAQRKGYSGVATFCREKPLSVARDLGIPAFDSEGRVLVTEHKPLTLVNAYVPSGQRGHERVEFKIQFSDALLGHCLELRAGGCSLVVCGDLNTAHQPIDLARPKQNVKTSGFLPEEREALGRWLDNGFVDIYRHTHPEAQEYTWWSYRYDARARDVGWRLDYFLVSEDLLPLVESTAIRSEVAGSDHCPVELMLALP